METKKIKCDKCGKEFDEKDCVKTNKGYLCKRCLLKTRKMIYSIIAGAIVVIAIGVCAYYLQNAKRRAHGFAGVTNIQDSVNVTVDNKGKTTFKMETVVAQSTPVETAPTIDNIESFKSSFEESVQNTKSSNANSIVIPAINVLFAFNKADLGNEAIDLLKEYSSAYLMTNKQAIILVDGYACNLGTDGINNWISKQRAEKVKSKLLQAGIPENKIEIRWFGKSKNSQFSYPTQKDYRRVNIYIK